MKIRQTHGSTTRPDYGDWWQASDGKWYPRSLHPDTKVPDARPAGQPTAPSPRSEQNTLFSGSSLEDWFRFFGWANLVIVWIAAAGALIGLINQGSAGVDGTRIFGLVLIALLVAGPLAALPWFAVAQGLNYLRRMTAAAERAA